MSTDDQLNDAQIDELLKDLTAGDVLVVVRLARSVSHLLQVIEELGKARVPFPFASRSNRHIHAAGHVFLQVLGDDAERTKAGIKAPINFISTS